MIHNTTFIWLKIIWINYCFNSILKQEEGGVLLLATLAAYIEELLLYNHSFKFHIFLSLKDCSCQLLGGVLIKKYIHQ